MNGQSLSSPSSPLSAGISPPTWVADDGTLHETYTILILVGGDMLGSFQLDPGGHPELRYRRSGAAYFCPDCGDVWARLVWVDSKGIQAPLKVETVSCERHEDQWNVAGSLLAGPLEDLLPHLPPEAIRREFLIHLKAQEKK